MIGAELDAATARLAPSTSSARLDAELLLAHVLGIDRGRLRARADEALPAVALDEFRRLVGDRARGVPVAYLTGQREFWSLELKVGTDVLVPRPETELLVEAALAHLKEWPRPRVLDLGTGSGAIGLAIARERPDAEVDLVDASAAALGVAEANRRQLALGNARTLHGHWFAPLTGRRYAAILANPPYLGDRDPHLAAAELSHEPRIALVSGPTGLEALAEIAAGAHAHLEAHGLLALEHGAQQGPEVRALLAAAGLEAVQTRRDLAGLERATLGTYPG